MPTSRPFAYNTGSAIAGTQQFGSLAVGTPTSGVTGNPRWWNGPDEELGYVIAQSVPENTQPAPDGSTASIGFFRSTALTESSFIQIAQRVSVNQTFATGNDAYLWLTGNSYWSSWVYSAASSAVTFSQTFTSGAAPGTTIENAWTTFRGQLTGTYTKFDFFSSNGQGYTGITDSVKVQQLANALRTGTTGINLSVVISGVTWYVGCCTCRSGGALNGAVEFSNVALCSGSSTASLRPFINNSNWGGIGSTVGAATQPLTLRFC